MNCKIKRKSWRRLAAALLAGLCLLTGSGAALAAQAAGVTATEATTSETVQAAPGDTNDFERPCNILFHSRKQQRQVLKSKFSHHNVHEYIPSWPLPYRLLHLRLAVSLSEAGHISEIVRAISWTAPP